MFPEYRDLITRLKTTDHHFTRLFDQHNRLDHKITSMVAATGPSADLEIEALKKQKLQLKDELYALLKTKAEQA
ncbi:MAG: YdcH family protein [Giesbergeria sp.]